MYQRLLVPVDGSELSEKAMHASLTLARQLGAAVTGFIAEPLQPLRHESRPHGLWEPDPREHDAQVAAHAQHVLKKFERLAQEAGVDFEGFHDQVPRIDEAIVAMAEARGCDMIVMVTHGRGAFGEFLYGSQTKAVLAGSKLPLLVLR
jgi:nucleotide-binding universal stress UspA family protein